MPTGWPTRSASWGSAWVGASVSGCAHCRGCASPTTTRPPRAGPPSRRISGRSSPPITEPSGGLAPEDVRERTQRVDGREDPDEAALAHDHGRAELRLGHSIHDLREL